MNAISITSLRVSPVERRAAARGARTNHGCYPMLSAQPCTLFTSAAFFGVFAPAARRRPRR